MNQDRGNIKLQGDLGLRLLFCHSPASPGEVWLPLRQHKLFSEKVDGVVLSNPLVCGWGD